MSPETLTQTVVEAAPQSVQAEPVKPQEDLVTRASKVSIVSPEQKPDDSISFNVKDFDKIQDPASRKLAEDAYKSMQADYTRKTQALASERKSMEALKAQLEQSGVYSPAKIQEMLNNPSFVQAAEEYYRTTRPAQASQPTNGDGTLSQEEFSYLSPEQQKLYLKTQQLETALKSVNSRLQSSEVEKEDGSLKSRYANYDPRTVNQIYNDMMTGKVQATREHLWKVVDYEEAVKRAYQLGKEDRKLETADKVNASSSPQGVNVIPSSDVPTRIPNESGIEYFKRIAIHNAGKIIRK